jgi:TolB protein
MVPTTPSDARDPLSQPPTTALPPPARATTGRIAFVSDRDGTDAIYYANSDGSGVTRLTIGHEPAWAPGGRRLAFERNGSIYTISVDGARESRVTEGWAPEWSPDGSRLVYVAKSGVHTINVDGSDARRVFDAASWNNTYAEYSASWPSWSPDGRNIAFIRTSYDDGWALYVVDVEGATPPRVLAQNTAENTSWSPDGSRILYTASRFSIGPPLSVPCCLVQMVAANGGSPVHVADGYWPDWTPTGEVIFEQFAIPHAADGKGLRIFTSSSDRPLIPEAISPPNADYSDRQPVWSR